MCVIILTMFLFIRICTFGAFIKFEKQTKYTTNPKQQKSLGIIFSVPPPLWVSTLTEVETVDMTLWWLHFYMFFFSDFCLHFLSICSNVIFSTSFIFLQVYNLFLILSNGILFWILCFCAYPNEQRSWFYMLHLSPHCAHDFF